MDVLLTTGVPYLAMLNWFWRGSSTKAGHNLCMPVTNSGSWSLQLQGCPSGVVWCTTTEHQLPWCTKEILVTLCTTLFSATPLCNDVSISNYHGERMNIEYMCATVAMLAISGCVLRNNQYHSLGSFYLRGFTSFPSKKPSAYHFCYILSQGYHGFVSDGWSCIQRKSYKSSAHWYLSTHKDSRRGHNAEA